MREDDISDPVVPYSQLPVIKEEGFFSCSNMPHRGGKDEKG